MAVVSFAMYNSRMNRCIFLIQVRLMVLKSIQFSLNTDLLDASSHLPFRITLLLSSNFKADG